MTTPPDTVASTDRAALPAVVEAPLPALFPAMTAAGPRRRWPLLALAGAAAFAIAYAFAPQSQEAADAVEPVLRARDAAKPPTDLPTLVTVVRPRIEPEPAANPFTLAAAPTPPPVVLPPPPPPPPPPVPTAPPLPFTFVGLLEKGGPKPAAFVARGDALLVVAAGDVIEGRYRVEAVGPREIVFTYLPLGERQTLTVSGDKP